MELISEDFPLNNFLLDEKHQNNWMGEKLLAFMNLSAA